MRTIGRKILAGMIVFLFTTMVFTLSTMVFAQGTPDDFTPVQETVCDGEEAPGRGLCVAYCEAMDCDDDPQANQTACAKVKQNWQNKTGGTNLPCEISCPCNDNPVYKDLSSGVIPATGCGYYSSTDAFSLQNATNFTKQASVSREQNVCSIKSGPFTLHFSISDAEADFCYQELEQQAISQGLTCTEQ